MQAPWLHTVRVAYSRAVVFVAVLTLLVLEWSVLLWGKLAYGFYG